MPSIETDVKGSPGTCREAASWLDTAAQGAHQAAGSTRAARGESETTWIGAAGDGFRNATNGVDGDTDQLGDHATAMASALNDFAGAIDSVATQMAQARNIAQQGGLTVSGTVIIAPAAPGPTPMVLYPCTASDPSGAQQQVAANSAAAQAHQQAVNTYNAQVRVFNQVNGIVKSARVTEQNAHDALNKAMTDSKQEASNLKSIGTTITASFLDSIKGSREGAQSLLDRANAFHDTAQTYQNFATGHVDLLSPAEVALLNRLGNESDALEAINKTKATQLESWSKLVPQNIRNIIAANPSQLVSDSSMYLKYLKPFLKGMPYVGTLFTVGAAAVDVAGGDKSAGRAVGDGAAEIAGNSAGGVAGEAAGEAAGGFIGGMFSGAEAGFLAGSAEPGLGNAVGAVVGGVAGGFLGGAAVKNVVDSAVNATSNPQQAQQNFQNTNYGSPSMIYPG